MAERVFDAILDVAADHHGFVSTAEAQRRGIHPANLRVLAQRGRLEHVRRGVYRVPQFPADSAARFHEAVLAIGHNAVVSHASALELHELGADLNPTQITVTVPAGSRIRRQIPRSYRIVSAHLESSETEIVEGVPATTVRRALHDLIVDGTDPRIVAEIIATATSDGHLSAQDSIDLRRLNTRR